ncbi:MAG: DUF4410 domain-containing protein [Candidatus Thiodiazotropha taylori]|uniref:DUF4410 domain-containing protein n=1 Tax=Candidatus Thiodiazotropha taylori TaxID=2792791 RepID=A0A9E4N475_9GAMM|nr:DUF4410 domain-containing protein [Candidatus Thiodiazotropha taylori]MCW4257316.1 DUF4410 domain-containing protein [Candidatus Thiodiazotropha taylori]
MRQQQAVHLFMLILILMLTGCSSSVERGANGSTQSGKIARSEVNEVTIHFSDEVKEKIKDVSSFDMIRFNETVISQLDNSGLLNAASDKSVEITITGARFRHTALAALFGFMAGADHITGNVLLKDDAQNTIDEFVVSASYALGGAGGANEETRISWMYGKFAELTAQTLSGEVDPSATKKQAEKFLN